jgi:hypothetical protein
MQTPRFQYPTTYATGPLPVGASLVSEADRLQQSIVYFLDNNALYGCDISE